MTKKQKSVDILDKDTCDTDAYQHINIPEDHKVSSTTVTAVEERGGVTTPTSGFAVSEIDQSCHLGQSYPSRSSTERNNLQQSIHHESATPPVAVAAISSGDNETCSPPIFLSSSLDKQFDLSPFPVHRNSGFAAVAGSTDATQATKPPSQSQMNNLMLQRGSSSSSCSTSSDVQQDTDDIDNTDEIDEEDINYWFSDER